MGEIADEITSGAVCECCQRLFVLKHGFPVACKECYPMAIRSIAATHELRKPDVWAEAEGATDGE